MVFLGFHAPCMNKNRHIRRPTPQQFLTDLLTSPGIKLKSCRFYPIGEDMKPMTLTGPSAIQPDTGLHGTGKQIIRLKPQGKLQYIFHHCRKPAARRCIVTVGNGNPPCPSGFGQVEGSGAAHMSMDNGIFRMYPEEFPPLPSVTCRCIPPKRSHGIDSAAHPLYFFRIITYILCMDDKIKLYPFSVHMPVQIHHHGFRTAPVQPPQHMQDPHRFFCHFSHSPTPAAEYCKPGYMRQIPPHPPVPAIHCHIPVWLSHGPQADTFPGYT